MKAKAYVPVLINMTFAYDALNTSDVTCERVGDLFRLGPTDKTNESIRESILQRLQECHSVREWHAAGFERAPRLDDGHRGPDRAPRHVDVDQRRALPHHAAYKCWLTETRHTLCSHRTFRPGHCPTLTLTLHHILVCRHYSYRTALIPSEHCCTPSRSNFAFISYVALYSLLASRILGVLCFPSSFRRVDP